MRIHDRHANLSRDPALPSGPTEYHQFLRTPGYRWWKAVLAIVLIPVAYVVSTFTLTWGLTAVSGSLGLGLVPPETPGDGVVAMSPARLLASNLAIGLLIPISLGLQRLLFGQPGRWMHSVHGRFRWKLALNLAGVLVPVWIVYGIVWTLMNPEAAGVSGPSATLASTIVLFVIGLLTSPLQGAGEEYAARGLLARSFGSFTTQRTVSLLVALLAPNLMFTVVHGLAGPLMVVYTFSVGLACAVITWRTGGGDRGGRCAARGQQRHPAHGRLFLLQRDHHRPQLRARRSDVAGNTPDAADRRGGVAVGATPGCGPLCRPELRPPDERLTSGCARGLCRREAAQALAGVGR